MSQDGPAVAVASLPGGGKMTCITCRLQFATLDERKEHYKEEWHRFNLKRKLAGLSPVTKDAFEARLNDLSASAKAKKGTQHLSQKQKAEKERKEKLPAKNDEQSVRRRQQVEVTDEDLKPENNPEGFTREELQKLKASKTFALEECLFDNHMSDSFQNNLTYMTKNFGFFIAEIEYLVDLEGLIKYLGEKVGTGNVCLYCQKAFKSVEAVQKHMVDKSHCKLDWKDGGAEYSDYYDYSSSYLVGPEASTDAGDDDDDDCKDVEEEEWEDVSDDGGEVVLENPEEIAAFEAEERRKALEREERLVNRKVQESRRGIIGTNDAGEFILANGRVVGHRALRPYYQQKLVPRDVRRENLIAKLMQQYQALGYVPRDKTKYNQMPAQARDRKNQFMLKTGLQNNNQKHFREQVLF